MLFQDFGREVFAIVTVSLLAGAIGCSGNNSGTPDEGTVAQTVTQIDTSTNQMTRTLTVLSTPLTAATFGTNKRRSEQTGPIR